MIPRILLLPAAGLLALSACAVDPNAYPDDPNGRTKDGAILGGLTGAVIGATQSDNELAGAVVGGVLGAAVGGAIGSSLDDQAAALRGELGNSAFTVTNMGDYLVVNMPNDVLFAVDSASLSSGLVSDIQAVARNLIDYPNSTIEVVGHTDNTGEAAYNQDLSERRAISVRDVLVASGVPASRVAALGRGEDQPVASNLTPEGQAQNRRVEIIIRPTK